MTIDLFEADLFSSDLPTALASLMASLLGGAAAWAVLVALLASWRPTARLAVRLTPRILRAIVFTGVSGALAVGPAGAALADDLDGLPLPDRPATVTRPAPDVPAGHVVKPGESLWTIAAATLPPSVGDADTAQATAQWYAANRRVIGANPDLIRPGQVLASPSDGDDR